MALHLNLYHEIQKTRALKRRDPLKISLYGLGAIAVLFVSWYVLQLLQMQALKDDFNRKKAVYDKLAPIAKEAKKKEDELTIKSKASEALVQRLEERFYWAPIMAQLLTVVPREIQIVRLNADLPTDGVQRCSIVIDGLSAGADPRKTAEQLRTALADTFKPKYKKVTSTFRTLEDGTELVMLDGKQVPTATFAIVLQLFLADPAPEPVVTRKKR